MTSGTAFEVPTAAVLTAAAMLEAASDELGRLDAVAGDGDHGIAVSAAARAVRQRIEDRDPKDVFELLDLVTAELSAVGGSIGAISYVLIDAVARCLATLEPPLRAEHVSVLLGEAESAVVAFGGARPGDKSIVDAIDAAQKGAEASARETCSVGRVLAKAASAAQEGASATAFMEARVGRASRLGERGFGSVDPGARSFAIALQAVAETYSETAFADEARNASEI